jgi:hypothetical protein
MFLAAKDPAEHSIADANDALPHASHRMAGFGEDGSGFCFPAFRMQTMCFGYCRKRDKRRKGNDYSEG